MERQRSAGETPGSLYARDVRSESRSKTIQEDRDNESQRRFFKPSSQTSSAVFKP